MKYYAINTSDNKVICSCDKDCFATTSEQYSVSSEAEFVLTNNTFYNPETQEFSVVEV